MQLKFSIKSSTHYLALLRKFVSIIDKLVVGIKMDHKAKLSCELALVEAVNNAIFHAHKRCEEKWIGIVFKNNGNAFEMRVYDRGEGFFIPEFSVPEPDKTHGRGLYIIKTLMHEVKYVRGKSNMLRMKYYL